MTATMIFVRCISKTIKKKTSAGWIDKYSLRLIWFCVNRDLLLLVGIVSAFLAIGGVLIATRSLPEDSASTFNPLSAGNMTLKSEIKVIKESTSSDDTYIYAINDVAEKALYIALNDSKVQQILNETNGATVTIAALQPTLLTTSSGELIHSSGGQVIITANRQFVEDKSYLTAQDFDSLKDKRADSSQQIWNVIVNMDKGQVVEISESKRTMDETLEKDIVFTGMNMFMPDRVRIDSGSTVLWLNKSSVPHNIVGVYEAESESRAIDSDFIEQDRSFRYNFDSKGVFEYRCTIHAQDGMKGTIIVGN